MINKKDISSFFLQNMIIKWKQRYITHSLLKDYIEELVNNWYEIHGYDGIIINEAGTLSPLSLIFDFTRENYSPEEKNTLAKENISLLIELAKTEFNINNLYVDVVGSKIDYSKADNSKTIPKP